MSSTLSGSVAVVTGGARGIGRACALRLATLGARVAVIDRNLDSAMEFGEALDEASVEDELRTIAGEGAGVQTDLTEPGGAEAAINSVVHRWGRLDILVTAAGGAVTPYDRSGASVTSDADLSKLVEVNLGATVSCCRSAVPHMRDAGGGAIVTVGSSAGLTTVAGGYLAAYGMTKAGIQHYTKYLAVEVGKWGIRANCVAPGAVRTARVIAESSKSGTISDEAAARIPLGRQAEVSDIADAVQYLTTPLSAYVSGQILAVNGGAFSH